VGISKAGKGVWRGLELWRGVARYGGRGSAHPTSMLWGSLASAGKSPATTGSQPQLRLGLFAVRTHSRYTDRG